MKKNTATPKTEKNRKAKKATRLKILKAARKVFAQRAYHAASIRMIGKEAGIDHPLISYYFPSKAVLFEAVLADILEEWHKANQSWFDGLEHLSPIDGLSLYIDRMLDYSRKHPYAAQVFLLNMLQAQDADTIPGYQAIQAFFDRTTRLLINLVPMRSSKSDIEKFTQSFNTLVLSYIGAKSYYTGILGMSPHSREYREWVKGALMDIMLPRLKQLMHGEPT
jgi:AcrR family transcriptional regulator